MKQLGLPGDPASNSFRYLPNTPLVNSMLNIKYMMGKGTTIDDNSLSLVKQSGISTAYINKYFLSLGYMVDRNVVDNWNTDSGNPFTVQNDFIKYATSVKDSVFTEVDPNPSYTGGNNVIATDYYDGILYCAPNIFEDPSDVEIIFRSTKEQDVFAFVESVDAESVTARRANGETVTFENNCGSILSLGRCEAGEEIFINLHFAEGKASNVTAHVYGMDSAKWEQAYSELNSNILNVTSFSDTKVLFPVYHHFEWKAPSLPTPMEL